MEKSMGNSGQTWSLLLILVCISQSLQDPCQRRGPGCDFKHEIVDECEFSCPSAIENTRFTIRIWPTEKIAKIMCNMNPPWSYFKLNSTGEVEDVKEVRFESCFLPEVPLHEITKRIGVQPTQTLKFESYKNLSSVLERRHLSGFPKIQYLSLHSNSLGRVPDDLLDDFPELISLMLRENDLKDLPEKFFSKLSKLQTLELGNNKMTHINPLLFSGLNRLQFLNLWNNKLNNIEPRTFIGLTALRSMDLKNNNLRTLHQDVFKPLTNLTELSITGNNFSSLPEDLFSENRNLAKLTLNSNRGVLTTLPHKFLSNLPRLKEVYLVYNKLTYLPEDLLSNSSSIKILDLSHNSLSTLPKSIFSDSINLTSLNLSWNKIASLPGRIFQSMARLEKLELQNNEILQITRDLFSGLQGLKDLNLGSNGMQIIEGHSFKPLRSLEFARLSDNNITLNDDTFGLPYSPFSDCEKLIELHLANNNITQIFEDWRILLPKLNKINLTYNQISKIDTYDLNFIPDNLTLDIRHNNIKEINLSSISSLISDPKTTFAANRNVVILVDENPIICDCSLNSFLKYLNGHMHRDVQKLFHIKPDQLKCSGPQFMAGTRVSELKDTSFKCYKSTSCGEKCDCWLREYDRTIIANCSDRGLREVPEGFNLTGYNVELDLSGNFLTEMPSVDKAEYGNVTAILLSQNNISNFSANAVPPTLKVLELDGNNMKRMNTTALKIVVNSTPLKRLTLHRNPWICDCETNNFRNFIQNNRIKLPEIWNTSCGDTAHEGKILTNLTADELCPSATGQIIAGSLSVAAVGLLIGIVAVFCFKYQFEIEIWLYNHPFFGKLFAEETVDNKTYDAFVSHAHQDQKFVDEELIPKLENGADAFKLCVHYRDWNVGEVIPEQIARSVEESRRTILVVSPDFIKSMWGKLEFQAAHRQALNDRRRRVIIIIYGEIGPTDKLDEELRAYLKMNTYVKWGDPWFWDKLTYAMPHRRRGRPLGKIVQRGRSQKERNILRNHQQLLELNPDRNVLVHPPGALDSPPPLTTPPANSVNTFMSNNSAKSEVVIADCLRKEMANINASNIWIDSTQERQSSDRKITDGKDTIISNQVNTVA